MSVDIRWIKFRSLTTADISSLVNLWPISMTTNVEKRLWNQSCCRWIMCHNERLFKLSYRHTLLQCQEPLRQRPRTPLLVLRATVAASRWWHHRICRRLARLQWLNRPSTMQAKRRNTESDVYWNTLLSCVKRFIVHRRTVCFSFIRILLSTSLVIWSWLIASHSAGRVTDIFFRTVVHAQQHFISDFVQLEQCKSKEQSDRRSTTTIK